MPRLIYTASALDDLSRLRDFLQSKDPAAALRAIATIRLGLRKLADRPAMGRPARDMPPGVREWFIRFGRSGHVALCRSDASMTVVLAVRHVREAGY